MILNERILRQAALEAQRSYESYSYSIPHFDAAENYDLFISHSFKDKNLVTGLYHLFSEAGYKVYIDWIDDSNLDRKSVTPDTAAIIKRRIKSSKGAAYIATANSTTSKWCPWELGVSDGMHDRVCILPVMDYSFKGQEYLGLYPYLEYGLVSGKQRNEFRVHDQQDKSKYVTLRGWLEGSKPHYH